MTSLPASLIVHTEARDGSKHITGMNTVWVALEKQRTRAESRMKEYEDGASTSIYFFLEAFSADFVTLPPDLSVLSTDLMTPTATVCLMSRTAKRPRGGYSL